ncbi:unnamed protein product, partial [Peniophora sp. CBMAI 1063]
MYAACTHPRPARILDLHASSTIIIVSADLVYGSMPVTSEDILPPRVPISLNRDDDLRGFLEAFWTFAQKDDRAYPVLMEGFNDGLNDAFLLHRHLAYCIRSLQPPGAPARSPYAYLREMTAFLVNLLHRAVFVVLAFFGVARARLLLNGGTPVRATFKIPSKAMIVLFLRYLHGAFLLGLRFLGAAYARPPSPDVCREMAQIADAMRITVLQAFNPMDPYTLEVLKGLWHLACAHPAALERHTPDNPFLINRELYIPAEDALHRNLAWLLYKLRGRK